MLWFQLLICCLYQFHIIVAFNILNKINYICVIDLIGPFHSDNMACVILCVCAGELR